MNKYILVIVSLLFAFATKAEIFKSNNDTVRTEDVSGSFIKESFVIVGYQNLRSTHIDHFTGFNMMVGHYFTPKFSLGIGFEDTYGQHHDDNGWILSEIRLIPIIVNARFLFGKNKLVTPFIELSTGITFLKYYKKVKVPPGSPDITETEGEYTFGPPFLVEEKGWYTYAGGGVYFRIYKHFMPFIGIGFKGYNMSTNVYAVNPRGLNFEIGCKF